MKIKSVRLGHANNSSSSHSIIFVKDDVKVQDEGDIGYFGWDFFTAKSREAKESYLFINMVSSLESKRLVETKYVSYDLYLKFKKESILSLLRENAKYFDFFTTWDQLISTYENDEEGYVDHQSVMDLPVTRSRDEINFEFYADFCKELLKPNYIILGGNDNTEETHDLFGLNDGVPELVSLLAYNNPY